MAFELLDNRNRAIGLALAVGVNGLLLALLLSLARDVGRPVAPGPGLATFDVAQPPPPAPPPAAKPAGGAAPPSRGATRAPPTASPPHRLPRPTPVSPAADVGSGSASGTGAIAGSGGGQGGQGSGSGAAGSGTGSGGGTPPVHVAGALTNADYARSGLPRGATGTVKIGFRVRSDGGVDDCRVERSSGYAAIDSQTCRLVEQRFRFRPARDSANRPIDFSLHTDFTWRPR